MCSALELCGFAPERHPYVDDGACYLQSHHGQGEERDSFIRALGLEQIYQEPRAGLDE